MKKCNEYLKFLIVMIILLAFLSMPIWCTKSVEICSVKVVRSHSYSTNTPIAWHYYDDTQISPESQKAVNVLKQSIKNGCWKGEEPIPVSRVGLAISFGLYGVAMADTNKWIEIPNAVIWEIWAGENGYMNPRPLKTNKNGN